MNTKHIQLTPTITTVMMGLTLPSSLHQCHLENITHYATCTELKPNNIRIEIHTDEGKHVHCKLSKLHFITAKSSNAANSNTRNPR